MTVPLDSPDQRRHDRSMEIMEGVTLTLLAIGIALGLLLVPRLSLEAVLLGIAGTMLAISTVVSMHRRRRGYEPAIQGRRFGLGFLLSITPNLLILTVVVLTFAKAG